jgi:hypothetical protein
MADFIPESPADIKSEPVADMLRNLEASVRSRDARHRTAGIGGDLIEAGLN